ncbi:hypothetical protein BKA65DRAFT_475180 [Rhexocercosporidium sp. MPI-PUGE-AT-0058]|nr:hypothetical protein BKA65DRAFT_475180 [Rhexocercosporidium sp. MPI-PUGE-AT-0058]
MSTLPHLEPVKTNSMPLPSTGTTTAAATTTTSPTRPKHLTTRSITEVNPPPSLPRIPHHHGHISKHHHPHIHHHRLRDGGRDGSASGEAGGIGGSRSEGHTPSESRVGSRRGSFRGEDGGELRNALNTLNTHSNLTTRRLDTTYYSVLEKLSALQSTITSLKELAHLTRGLTEEFATEAQEVVDDATGQVDGFDGFRAQEGRIKGLMERVSGGGRGLKERVEGWEVAEREWQDKTRRRLRALWVGMSFVVGVMVVLMAVRHTPVRTAGGGLDENGREVKGLNVTGLLGVFPDMKGLREGNESWNMVRKGVGEGVLEKLRENERDGLGEEDPRLRVFDEL